MNYQIIKKAPWNPDQYITEHKRDIHIWCMGIGNGGSWRQGVNFGLVGGCCAQEVLKARIFYYWIGMMISDQSVDSNSIVLVPGFDPRKVSADELKDLFESYGYMDKALKKDNTMMLAGHYFLFKKYLHQTRQNSSRLVSFWPLLYDMPKKERNMVKDDSRSELTKEQTILRDQGCRITRERFYWWPMKPNTAGYPVIHIIALFSIDQIRFMNLIPSNSPIKHLLSDRKTADKPYNTMVMRADLHALYDDYQFSIWYEEETETTEAEFYIIRFENGGAPNLEGISTVDLRSMGDVKKYEGSIDAVNGDLFWEHTRLCLLRRVCGAGKIEMASVMLRNYPDAQS